MRSSLGHELGGGDGAADDDEAVAKTTPSSDVDDCNPRRAITITRRVF